MPATLQDAWPPRPSQKNKVLFKTLNYEFYLDTTLLKRVSDNSKTTLAEIYLYSPQGKMESISLNGGKTVSNFSELGLEATYRCNPNSHSASQPPAVIMWAARGLGKT